MCGIAGVYSFDGMPADRHALLRSIRTLRHRGPDDTGLYVDGHVGLAHARLSIIDIDGGGQPMQTEDGSLAVTFNGEIFNYIELREELEGLGHQFRTRSDTEVILRMYQEFSDACVERFNGQWAFALWDRRIQRLLLSRDRFGVRPLYYTAAGNRFLFASEAKALFEYPEVERRIDIKALVQIFTFWVPLAPRTIFHGIQEIPPGHSVTVDKGGMRSYRHWTPHYTENTALNGDSGAQLLELLKSAVEQRLRSDVPVGAYLSGGLDSTLTAALIRRTATAPLKTFSVQFDDPEFDETPYQREAVAFLGTEHEEIRCTSADIGRVFPEVIRHTERPILRTAPAPLFLLSKLVHDRGYKVVLTGEGADEVFAGYDIFKEAKLRDFCARHPESHLRPLLYRRLYPYLPGLRAQSDAYRQAFFQTGEDALFGSHISRWRMTSKLRLFLSESIRQELRDYDPYDDLRGQLPTEFPEWNWLNRAQHLEMTYLLPGYILSSQGDRVAMAHSVEGRFPFLDHRVAEFASRLPSHLKIRALREKYLLKTCARGLVPESIRRRPKQPYRAPEAAALTGTEYVPELLSQDCIHKGGLFNAAAVERLTSKTLTGIGDNMAFVGILSTQILIDQFIHHANHNS
ncbi:MAG TPA: asparagine synthase (glutamine-hydrolyzing) [Bryobacteraceae bacterium]|nr:asparagine synthase (glutamine-hydrolyzing) [Bryobacteraceae bacterium]